MKYSAQSGGSAAGSSTIRNIDYDEKTQQMTIDFHRSGTYVYYQITPAVYAELMAAPSKGQFLHQRIKNRYHAVRIDG